MSLDDDVKNVQISETKNGKVTLITAAIAVVVILTAACGAVYLTIQRAKKENTPHGAATATVPLPVHVPVRPVHDGGQLFLMYDPDCKGPALRNCELVLFNMETKKKVTMVGQDDGHKICSAEVSPNGKVFGFIRSEANDTSHHIILVDRNGKVLRKLDCSVEYTYFSFTPDNNGIIYAVSSSNEKEIRRVDLNDLNDSQFTGSKSILASKDSIHYPVFLKNGTLVYSIIDATDKYKVCMFKAGSSYCWANEFENLEKLIPHDDIIYCVELDGKIWKIDTSDPGIMNNTEIELKSITVASYPVFYSGTISEDGKILYLIVSRDEEAENALIKVNIESAFKNQTTEIISEDIVTVMPMFKGDVFESVPTLHEV